VSFRDPIYTFRGSVLPAVDTTGEFTVSAGDEWMFLGLVYSAADGMVGHLKLLV